MKRIDCYVCDRERLSKDEVGLNKKLFGRSVEKFHCMVCLADFLTITVDDLIERIEEFKDDGCTLFD